MNKRNAFTAYALCGLALVICASGCVSLAANLIGMATGNTNPAEYEGLKDHKVAIVCASDSGIVADAVSTTLTSYIHANLNTNIKNIEVIRPSKVERWLESHPVTEDAFIEIGEGIGADKVVAIEISNLKLKNGATLFKGQADVTVTVIDIDSGGDIVYRKQMPEFVYPTMGGPSITDTSESRFRGLFLSVLADKISGLFYEVDVTEDFALDAKSNSF